MFWDLYCAAPERRDTCEHSSEAKAFHDYVSIHIIFLRILILNSKSNISCIESINKSLFDALNCENVNKYHLCGITTSRIDAAIVLMTKYVQMLRSFIHIVLIIIISRF